MPPQVLQTSELTCRSGSGASLRLRDFTHGRTEPARREGRRSVVTVTSIRQGAARELMWGMLASGLALQVAGCITAVVQVPRTELEATGPVEMGDRTLMLVTFGLGGVLSLTAVVAFGVLLGMLAHAQE